jgi:hypothetical protein
VKSPIAQLQADNPLSALPALSDFAARYAWIEIPESASSDQPALSAFPGVPIST